MSTEGAMWLAVTTVFDSYCQCLQFRMVLWFMLVYLNGAVMYVFAVQTMVPL